MNQIIILLLVFVVNSFAQDFDSTKKSAEQGHAFAQHNLGLMYYRGEGVLTDKKKAVYWYKKSAELGYAGAQSNLGLMYDHGEGVLTDKKKAAFWIKKSYENDFIRAKEIWNKYELWQY